MFLWLAECVWYLFGCVSLSPSGKESRPNGCIPEGWLNLCEISFCTLVLPWNTWITLRRSQSNVKAALKNVTRNSVCIHIAHFSFLFRESWLVPFWLSWHIGSRLYHKWNKNGDILSSTRSFRGFIFISYFLNIETVYNFKIALKRQQHV